MILERLRLHVLLIIAKRIKKHVCSPGFDCTVYKIIIIRLNARIENWYAHNPSKTTFRKYSSLFCQYFRRSYISPNGMEPINTVILFFFVTKYCSSTGLWFINTSLLLNCFSSIKYPWESDYF